MIPLSTQLINNIGFLAAFLTTAAFVPQLLRVIQTRSARDISLPTFLFFSLGVALWLVYGILAHDSPVIASNSVTLILSVSILVLKLRFDREDRTASEARKTTHP